MALYAIDYDLVKPGRNYQDLFAAIKDFPDWAHLLESSWVVQSSMSASQIRDHLLPHIDTNDKLVVKKLTGEAAWYGLDPQVSAWLRETRV